MSNTSRPVLWQPPHAGLLEQPGSSGESEVGPTPDETHGVRGIDVVFCLEALEEALEFGKPGIFIVTKGYNLPSL
jgi:hypothetical protein